MDDQTQQNLSIANAAPSSGTVASDNFDHWAKAVRQQMLDCLQKRTERNFLVHPPRGTARTQ